MKKRMSILMALALAVSVTACSSQTSSDTNTAAEETAEASEEETSEAAEAAAGETYTGTVAAISGDSITVTTEDGDVAIPLSSETEFSMSMGEGGDMGGAPDGAGGEPGEMGEGGGPGGDGQAPAGEDGEAPEKPEGEEGEAPDSEGGAPGEMGEGGPDGEGGGEPGGGPDGAGSEPGEGGPDGEGGEPTEGADSGISTLELPEGEDTIGGMNGEGGAPDGEGGPGEDGEAPEKPDGEEGEAPDGEGGAPGEMGEGGPDGEGGGDPGAGGMGEGGEPEAMTLTYEDVSEGDEVTVVVGEDGTAASVALTISMDGGMNGAGGMGGGSTGVDSYDAVNTYTEDTEVDGEEISSTGADENAVLVETGGITVELDDVTIVKDSDDSTGGDNSSFYGVGAAALVTDGTLVVEDSTITSDSAGGAGVFAYGDGVAYVSDTTITTVQDTSGGIHVAGGGTLYAWDLTVDTSGESSAAIRSDRGSGTMVVDGGTYTSNWTGSPAVYSTADIMVHDATLTANKSEAICIEGLNTIRLFDCDLTGTMQDLETNDCIWTVILYQSMSGDSEVGNSTFEMVGGSLTANSGGLFYTTNTESTFIISDVDITCSDTNDFLLKVTGNANQRGWGTTGANGADCRFTALDQELSGTVIWDSISTLEFYLVEGSTLTGSFVDDETNAGDGGDGYANVYISNNSTWVVTGDSMVTGLYSAGTIADADGNTVSVVGTDGTVYVDGTSAYTITVETYVAEVDLSGASSVDSWEDFEVEEQG